MSLKMLANQVPFCLKEHTCSYTGTKSHKHQESSPVPAWENEECVDQGCPQHCRFYYSASFNTLDLTNQLNTRAFTGSLWWEEEEEGKYDRL